MYGFLFQFDSYFELINEAKEEVKKKKPYCERVLIVIIAHMNLTRHIYSKRRWISRNEN